MRKRRGRGSKLGKFESMYFLNTNFKPISSIADEILKFISRGLIFANSHFLKISRGLIFAKTQKIREIAKINPRKVDACRIKFWKRWPFSLPYVLEILSTCIFWTRNSNLKSVSNIKQLEISRNFN